MAVLVLLLLGAGISAGLLQGGRLHRVGQLRFRAPGLALSALFVQVSVHRAPQRHRFGLVLVTYALVGAWIVLNLRGRPRLFRVAVGLVALGWALNTAAIVGNRGMPVSTSALASVAGRTGLDPADGHLFKHVGARHGTTLAWLGDAIPVRPLRAVISVGDILLAGGLAALIAAAMTAGGEPRLLLRAEARST